MAIYCIKYKTLVTDVGEGFLNILLSHIAQISNFMIKVLHFMAKIFVYFEM